MLKVKNSLISYWTDSKSIMARKPKFSFWSKEKIFFSQNTPVFKIWVLKVASSAEIPKTVHCYIVSFAV